MNNKITNIALKGIAPAMRVAVMVLSTLKTLDIISGVSMCGLGLAARSTSVSPSAAEKCKANGIAVIPGSCPAQSLEVDFGHGLMRRLWNMFGYLVVD